MSAVDVEQVRANLARLRARIERCTSSGGRDPRSIRIVAVTKGFGADAPSAALAAGLTDIGENYYQEAAQKFGQLPWPPDAVRHFIGHVQRNKAVRIAALFDVVQTVANLDAARALDRGAVESNKRLDVLVQINVVSDERQGVPAKQVAGFVAEVQEMAALRVRGLMAMGPDDATQSKAAFERARASFDSLRKRWPNFDTLSMGMTGDMDAAIAAGSTMLRIGTALFGARVTAAKR